MKDFNFMDFLSVPSASLEQIQKKGLKKVVLTEGGAFPQYERASKPAQSFRKTFAKKCKGKGAGDTFKWHGRSYSCARK